MTKAIIKLNNYSNYEIYPKDGKIWSLKRDKFIGDKTPNGYFRCTLYSDNGHIWKENVHRLIYIACYGEIPKGMQVNHIDEDKTNNSIFNLNLMTPKENNNWGTRNERVSKAKKGTQINRIDLSMPVGAYKNGALQFTFLSTADAGRNGFDSSNVSKCCRGVKGYKSYKGYQWKYIDEKVD